MRFEPKQRFILNIKDKESQKFLIPEYQRPYRWKIDECQILWGDIISVFCEKRENEKFEYFLGSIVSFENSNGDLEIIDGQQRITTLTLLFRAFFESLKSEGKKDEFQDDFGKFIWKKIRNEGFVFNEPYLSSQVITDKDKKVLEYILIEDIDIEKLKSFNSNYAKNFIFFHDAINDFKLKNASEFSNLCDTILSDTFFVLCVTCDSQESAMTIFNTLNSRGMPLSNADIIKGYIYKNIENKEEFAKKWQEISSKFEEYSPKEDMSVLFIQAMHAIRALHNYTDSTTPSVLDFFTNENKKFNFGAEDKYLVEQEKIKELMNFIEILVYFWGAPEAYLSQKAYRYFKILCLYQNDMWRFFVAFLVWRNKNNFIKDEFNENFNKEFEIYLLELLKAMTVKILNNKTNTNEIKDLVFKMNAELNQNINFSYSKFLPERFLNNFSSSDKNIKPDARKVKYLLYLYAHLYDDFSSDIQSYKLEVEHILPKTWQNTNFDEWNETSHSQYLEQIGNKILLNKLTNIKCANNFFSLKQEKYKESQNSQEVRDLGNRENKIWSKADIEARNKAIEQALKKFINK